MDLNFHDVIVRPRVTSKAYRLNQQQKQLVLEVHPQATKPMIARALKALFNVDVERIGIVSVAAKRRRAGMRIVVGASKKKAIITLKAGSAENVMDWASLGQQGGYSSVATSQQVD